MFKFTELFIPLATLLLAACTTKSTSTPTLTATPESSPAMESSLVLMGVSQPDLAHTLTHADTTQDQPNADVTYVRVVQVSDGT
jgi:uncharacterized lipoprotein YajG